MQKLDEVIDNFEKACDLERRCEGCSGCLGQENGCPNDGAECVPDALHYLKEYQKIEDEYHELKDWWAEEHAENVPLSWDELKQTEGMPVWVEWTVKGKWHHGDWNLVHGQVDDRIWFVDENGDITNVPKELQGISWQAYRKERK